MNEPSSDVITIGDFNLSSPNHCVALSHEGRLANELLNTLAHTEFSQMNSFRNNYNIILDLILTNLPHINVHETWHCQLGRLSSS